MEKVAGLPPKAAGPVSPKRPAAPAGRPTASTAVSNEAKLAKRAENATGFFEMLSGIATMAAMFTGNDALILDGAAFAVHAEDCGTGLASIAEKNGFVASLVDRLDVVNGAGSALTAFAPLAFQVVLNHQFMAQAEKAKKEKKEYTFEMPTQLMQLGVLPPNMLMEKAKAENEKRVAKIQAQVLREQKAAQDEVNKLREEVNQQNGSGRA